MIAAMPRNNSNHQFFASACTMADPRPVPDCRSVCTVVMGHSFRMIGRRPSSVIRNRPNATLATAGMTEPSKGVAPNYASPPAQQERFRYGEPERLGGFAMDA